MIDKQTAHMACKAKSKLTALLSCGGAVSRANRPPQKQHKPLSIQRKRGRERRSQELVKGSETEASKTSALDPF